jgi:phosphatidylinositol-3-phosphatase
MNIRVRWTFLCMSLAAGSARADLSSVKTVFVVVLENHNWSDLKGSPNAPYLNNTLLPQASHAEQYYNPPGNHPSLPNYLWLEAGTNFGVSNDDDPSSNHQGTTAHLVAQLNNAGISWKSYQEDIGGNNCPLTALNHYAPKHNPFVYFDDVTDTNNANSAYCIAHLRPFTELAGDLQANAVAQYVFVTPNLCNAGHDSCAPLNDPVRQTDNWLGANIPQILNSATYQKGGALFITWDEGEGGDGPIGMILMSPFAKGRGYSNSIHYTHGSLLRTIQEIFGVGLLGDAGLQTDLNDLFSATPGGAPTVNAVVNAASFRSAGIVAAGSIVTVFGTGFGAQDNLAAFPSTSVNGVSVLFGATAVPIFALSATSGQINVLAPADLPSSGTVSLTVKGSKGVSAAATLNLARAAPGIFFFADPLEVNRRNAVALTANTAWIAMPSDMAGRLGLPTNCTARDPVSLCAKPAHPGDYLEIYVTGLGKATPNGDPNGAVIPDGNIAPANGNPLYLTISAPAVTIGGQPATVLFSGVAPGFAGLYQVNVQIPGTVVPGDEVPIQIAMAGLSDSATLAIR